MSATPLTTLSLPSEKSRLIQDMEFVQMLANVEYVIWLAKTGYFKNDCFGNYLKSLAYLDNSNYSHFMIFPLGLSCLRLLSDDAVRAAIAEDPDISRNILAEQVYSSWANQGEVRST